jgi:hypothetical protein
MTAILALRLGRIPTADDVDHLAKRFLHLEQKASLAYKRALEWDAPHEKLKEELIDLALEFGTFRDKDGKVLAGADYQISADGSPPILVVRVRK